MMAMHVSRNEALRSWNVARTWEELLCQIYRLFLPGVVPEPPGQVEAAGEDGGGQARHSGLPGARRALLRSPARRGAGLASRLRPLVAHRPCGPALVSVAGLARVSIAPSGKTIVKGGQFGLDLTRSLSVAGRLRELPYFPNLHEWLDRYPAAVVGHILGGALRVGGGHIVWSDSGGTGVVGFAQAPALPDRRLRERRPRQRRRRRRR